MNEHSGESKNKVAKAPATRMIRFVCSRCNRQLVWAEASVTVKCPSCGRWIKANKFWQEPGPGRKAKKVPVSPVQMELF